MSGSDTHRLVIKTDLRPAMQALICVGGLMGWEDTSNISVANSTLVFLLLGLCQEPVVGYGATWRSVRCTRGVERWVRDLNAREGGTGAGTLQPIGESESSGSGCCPASASDRLELLVPSASFSRKKRDGCASRNPSKPVHFYTRCLFY
jgi:hypothetical protein